MWDHLEAAAFLAILHLTPTDMIWIAPTAEWRLPN
jgi:hypothetical protein